MRVAYLIFSRRARERVHSRKTPLSSRHSPIAETKHRSALSLSAVSRSERRYRLCISSVKVLNRSAAVAYGVALSSTTCIGSSIFIFILSFQYTRANLPEGVPALTLHAALESKRSAHIAQACAAY